MEFWQTKDMVAGILTKPLQGGSFRRMWALLLTMENDRTPTDPGMDNRSVLDKTHSDPKNERIQQVGPSNGKNTAQEPAVRNEMNQSDPMRPSGQYQKDTGGQNSFGLGVKEQQSS